MYKFHSIISKGGGKNLKEGIVGKEENAAIITISPFPHNVFLHFFEKST